MVQVVLFLSVRDANIETGTRESSALVVLVNQPASTYQARDADLLIEEQTKMNDCYFDKKDWRACKKEVRYGDQMNPETRTFSSILSNLYDSIISERKSLKPDCHRWRYFVNVGSGKEMIRGRTPRTSKVTRLDTALHTAHTIEFETPS